MEQDYGFATVSWDEVAGASEYHLERTPVDGDDPTGPGEVVGVWLPDRNQDPLLPEPPLAFADSGFVPGERYRWRVRAVVDGSEGDWSQPVAGDTQGLLGPEPFRTGFELSGGLEWTTHDEEVAYLEAVADASDRVRLEVIGETFEGRPVHLATVGDPQPMDPEEIAESPAVMFTCTVHGIERSGREACLILLRELAFSDDPWVTRILGQATVLINPTANPDGRAAGTRTNSQGQNLNRDHLVLRHPETFGLAEVQRDHLPEIVVDAHEKGSGADLEWMWARSLSVHEPLWALGQNHFVRGRLFGAAADVGWSRLQYPATPTGDNNEWEAWLANTPGLKNAVGLLQETPRAVPPSRPAEGPVGDRDLPESQPRRVYSHLWAFHEVLDYHYENLATIQATIAASEAAHRANQGPLYLDGRYDVPVTPPSNQDPTLVLDPPPCGYRLSAEQYAQQDDSSFMSYSVAERLAAHGIEVDDVGAGSVQVLAAQPLRGVIAYVLDPATDTSGISMVDAVRLDDRRATVVIGDSDTGVPNRVNDIGCTINDLIADEQAWPSRGRFIRHLSSVLRDLRADGLIDNRERGSITRAAVRSGIGRPTGR